MPRDDRNGQTSLEALKEKDVARMDTMGDGNASRTAPAVIADSINFLSVCSGIEAVSAACNPLGFQAVAFSEIAA